MFLLFTYRLKIKVRHLWSLNNAISCCSQARASLVSIVTASEMLHASFSALREELLLKEEFGHGWELLCHEGGYGVRLLSLNQ